ncbi:ankyrin repeat domain-containing protein [Flavobacterium sp. CYK-55]|uniref:ankyrin repeat domain-containing protein n=1 Tax=Flavobacterium sp. CYK-55 TaxID=2835529 RepID=UPI001BCB39EE|nr:ankyrin repeat domain-containing protein [Flavobacterium sp. CYK-55]MBS7785923.1 ankyrin repeat domain-containing protein [Flavobacterium sp. CYK-55]
MKKNGLLLLFIVVQFAAGQTNVDIFDIARKGTAQQALEAAHKQPGIFDSVNQDKFTPLILACYRGNMAVAQVILENKANIDANSPMGTALMAATVKGDVSMVELLLKYHPNLNLCDEQGLTALMYACMFKNKAIASLLLQNGAKKDLLDKKGTSAFEYATQTKQEEIIKLFK